MTKDEFETKYSNALKESNQFFQDKVSSLSKSIAKGINLKTIDPQTLQLSINIALKLNEISEQRMLFILEHLLINNENHP